MDTDHLLLLFSSSFSLDVNVRISAELELRKIEGAEGLIPILFQIILPSPNVSLSVRLAAAIYLKNRISSSYSSTPRAGSSKPIPMSDKLALKSNILPLLAALAADPASSSIKGQIEATLLKVVDLDFPVEWPTLMDEVTLVLGGGEGQVEAGLVATCAIMRGFRYIRNDPNSVLLNSIVAHIFPHILQLAQKIAELSPSTPETLASQGHLLHLIMKTYKHSIGGSLTPSQQHADSLIPWGTIFLQIIQKPIPVNLLPEDSDEREVHPWSKTKKWALYSLNRLFSRYGSPAQLPSNMKEYKEFANRFIVQLAPEMVRSYLGLVEKNIGGEWLPSKVKHHLLVFFDDCIKPKSTWSLLKPHIITLISSFIFPLICLTSEEIELFTEDPPEFARTHFGDFILDSYSHPCSTSLGLIASLVELRTSSTLMGMLNFIQEVSMAYLNGERTAREKDGAMRMLSSLAATATKSKNLAPMMESFFHQHVLPEFKSPHGFLRYRACEVVEKFESCDMDWNKRENLETMFRAIMDAVTDAELPVRIQAAITLPEIVRYEEVRAGMIPNIGSILTELLKMTNEVDLDALTNTTRSLVAEFSLEVIPFSVELAQSLMATYSRLVQEMIDQREKEIDDNYDDLGGEEKTLVCMNLLKTIDQLISSLEKSPLSLENVETVVAPGLELTIRANLVELYDEVYEILDSLAFFQKKISPCMYPIFDATYASFSTGGASDYFNEMAGFLDNFISFGKEVLANYENGKFKGMLVDMFVTVMSSRFLGAEDRCGAAKMAEAMLLNLTGVIDESLPIVIAHGMAFVLSKNDDEDFVVTQSLYLHSLMIVIASMVYSPSLTLDALSQSPGMTEAFFTAWFKNIPKLTRVHDKKMSILAICVLTEFISVVKDQHHPLINSVSKLISAALSAFKDLPKALEHRLELEKNFAEGDDSDEEVDNTLEEPEIADDYDDEEQEVVDLSLDHTAFLESQNAEDDGYDSDSSTWSEEILWASPLDEFDSYTRFTSCVTTLEIVNPVLFQMATTPLDLSQRSQLEAVALRAMAGGEKLKVEV